MYRFFNYIVIFINLIIKYVISTVAHLNLGQLLAFRGLCEEAEIVLRHCSKLDSTGVKDPKIHETTRISALLHLGRLLADRGRFNEAISIYKEAVNSLPEYYQPQVYKIILLIKLLRISKKNEILIIF